ncbi:BCCT family transporter [Microbacterium sp. EYE_5]|nr:BCCT family transporter [Microbacterium sp. EYE_382]MCK6084655.1 BCCT family transporter [Microbacterium sp. EYE_384]MCK6123116.1 BCCT family transporter [Microbacterium sp. EYE_80]MCK6125419.1 BCCT family transporter [Microbacterium sp. EYE_79]MCK6140339.1 BCCT family transporter [Microbacterium sp. EYE_39]MCK6217066.1 BCCT family transporter [Microbacterium sp. EYE_5]MCK6227447.1 BCCT family transporter [Microbacterium sp. EYE_77]MCK6246531.1 BCCT family transporter [Microbacterium sp. 
MWVIAPAAIVAVVFSAFAIALPTQAEAFFGAIQGAIIDTFSWYYVLITAFFVAFCLFLGFSRFGDIRLGKDDDKPEFSTGSWFSLLFAAGMGIGLVFYGVSEPLSHFVEPKPGVEGTPAQLAQSSLTQTYLHWGVQAWAVYVVVGIALAYAIHRRGRPLSIRWALEPILGRRVRGGWGNAIDAIALVGTLFGVATSLGLGVLQISSGLDSAGIISDPSLLVQVIIIAVITTAVLFSVLSGVTKGMKWLSSLNLILAGLLLLFVLFTNDTFYLLREWVQSIGSYLQDFIGLSFSVSAFQGAEGQAWQATWTSFYWGWWISWAPFVGIFIARVSRGRTVREFVMGVLIVPTLVGVLWFAVLGGSAVKLELDQPGTMTQADGTVNVEGALFQLFEYLPASLLLTIGALILIALFFVTSADSGALVMGMIATGGDPEPSKPVRTLFTLITALLAIALLIAGGLTALQTAAIIIALPFSIVMLLICWATVVAFQRERRIYEKAERAQLLAHIGDHYGLEVESENERGIRLPWTRRRDG